MLGQAELPPEVRINALDLRAEALDLLDRTAEAFDDYLARNALVAASGAARMAGEVRERRLDQARRMARFFRLASPRDWGPSAGQDAAGAAAARGHVFLLGFPRSGTTLIEKALAGHPDVVTLEEEDHLSAAAGHLLRDQVGLRSLQALNPAQAEPLRRAYWDRVAASFDRPIGDKVVLDKLPLHTPSLPLIAKLFPQARILFALRDPRDVVLSGFRRRFELNAAMFELLTLDGAAAFYDAVMTLAGLYRGLLTLEVREVRHEALVADFEGELRGVLDFIGVPWRPGVLDFAERAAARARTPTDLQLGRGLNADGVGQWRRYAAQVAPVADRLAPWVRRYGYGD
jgi:hypothetical protein